MYALEILVVLSLLLCIASWALNRIEYSWKNGKYNGRESVSLGQAKPSSGRTLNIHMYIVHTTQIIVISCAISDYTKSLLNFRVNIS